MFDEVIYLSMGNKKGKPEDFPFLFKYHLIVIRDH